MLETVRLNKSFGALSVTNNVSLRLEKGERRVVLGPNGAGKTTLFNLLAGELRPTSGQIRFDGVDVTDLTVDARARRGLARSYQKNNLFDDLTVRENLALAVATAVGASAWLLHDTLADRQIADRIEEVATLAGLRDLLAMRVSRVSYGARRQLEVALALAARPRILLMDEPTSGIGPDLIKAFHRLLKSLPGELTILIIEHDMDLAFSVADRITVMNYGEVVFEGDVEETQASPLVNEIYLGGSMAVHHELPHPIPRICLGAAAGSRILVLCTATALPQRRHGNLRCHAIGRERAPSAGFRADDALVSRRRHRTIPAARRAPVRRRPGVPLCRPHRRGKEHQGLSRARTPRAQGAGRLWAPGSLASAAISRRGVHRAEAGPGPGARLRLCGRVRLSEPDRHLRSRAA
jgi:ABC-type branched-subunit amino acid transport system ATPase component